MEYSVDLGILFVVDGRTLADHLFAFWTMQDLGRLDMALTNYRLRASLCEIYPLLCVKHLEGGLDKSQMIWLISRSINLETITFAATLSITDMAFILRQLNKGNNRSRIRHVDMSLRGDDASAALFSQLFNVCTNMQTLNLSGCKNISKDNIYQLSVLCSTLRSLDLTDCDLTKTVGALSKGFPSLTTLSLARKKEENNSMLKASAVKSLATGCPGLVSLDLSYCALTRDGTIISLAKALPSLTSLNLRGCDKITDTAIRTLSQCCPGLVRVELGVGADCSGKVTDSCVLALSHNCPALTTFGVSRCYNITDAAAILLARGCPALTCVDFTFCVRVTNEGVLALSQACTALTSISLAKCTKITGVAVTAISQTCPLLTTISLHSCAKITDASLIALAEGCKLLTSLDISHCVKITEEAILSVARSCRAMSVLHLVGCPGIMASGEALLVGLVAECPSLTLLESDASELVLLLLLQKTDSLSSRVRAVLTSPSSSSSPFQFQFQ
jgi:hypothetical protein